MSRESTDTGRRLTFLFKSLAEEFGPKGLAVLMTGMGDDGAQGLGMVKAAGGMTIAQNEESCVVYGMPKAAIDRGFAFEWSALDAMANTFRRRACRIGRRGFCQRVRWRVAESFLNRFSWQLKQRVEQICYTVFADKGRRSLWSSLHLSKRSKDGQPIRYLVVDDSVFARKNLARIVETFGGQVAGEAGDGMTAITEYDRTNPDIVLMDITMPQMEGIEAAEKIVGQHPEARIVMVSSVGYQENIVAALQRGARHFVQKPVKPEVLYEVIKYVLGEDGVVAAAAAARSLP